MEREVKILNDIDVEKISGGGGMDSRSDIESDKISHSEVKKVKATCILCRKDFWYKHCDTDPNLLEKRTFCTDCRLKKVKNIMIDPKGDF